MWRPIQENIARCPQCHARAKQTGRRCRNPVVPGRSVCRYHGGLGGAPKGNTNNFQHGGRSLEAEVIAKANTGVRVATKRLAKLVDMAKPIPANRRNRKYALEPKLVAALTRQAGEAIAATAAERDLAVKAAAERSVLAKARKSRDNLS